MINDHDILRYKNLFKGNPQAYGIYTASTNKSQTLRHPLKLQQFEMHLTDTGKGLGVVPVIDETTSGFGVLDFDNHKKNDAINLIGLEKTIRQKKLPLVVCRSKSGGAHVYLFGKKPLNTRILRQTMLNFADDLKGFGEKEIEIFPKQDKIDKHTVGNWINLPYKNGDNTERYAIINSKKATLTQFIDYAEEIAIDNQELLALGSELHKDAPPCISKLLQEKLDIGGRNIAIYNFCVYVKKAYPDSFEHLVYKYNAENFEQPLPHDEVSRVINSVNKSKYRYKCQEEPCKSRCDSNACILKKYGITPQDRNQLVMASIPTFGKLTKYVTEPVKYELEIEGKILKLSSQDLLDHKYFRRIAFEQLDKVLKPIKQDVWLNIVDELIKNVRLEEVPDDASQSGIIRNYAIEYMLQCKDRTATGKDMDERRHLEYRPIVVEATFGFKNKRRFIAFKGENFRKFLQTRKIGNIVGNNIYDALRKYGITAGTIRLPKSANLARTSIAVWAMPLIEDTPELDIYEYHDDIPEEPEYKTNIPENKPIIEYNKDKQVNDVIDHNADFTQFEPEF
jgi:hypothetical protein